GVRATEEALVEKFLQCRIVAPESVKDRDIFLNVAGPIPVPYLIFVFFRIEVFLASNDRAFPVKLDEFGICRSDRFCPTGNRRVFTKLIPIIDPIDAGQCRGEHEANAERWP